MKYLDYITGIINDAISGSLDCERAQMLGVAQSVRMELTEGKRKVWPGVYVGKGEMVYAGFEDNYDLCAYHRANGMQSRTRPGGYGDQDGIIVLTHSMSLVLYADREKLGKSADQLALILQFLIPSKLKREQLPERDFYSTRISITNTVLSEEQVFNEEFRNVDFFLGPEHVLLKVNYNIESELNKRCFNTQCRPDGAAYTNIS